MSDRVRTAANWVFLVAVIIMILCAVAVVWVTLTGQALSD